MKKLSTIEEWEQVKLLSFKQPQAIYIHSLTCPISVAVIRRLSGSSLSSTTYIVPVQTSRVVSDAVAKDLGIKHESPQIIVMEDGRSKYVANHWDIEPAEVISHTR